jgi:acyl-CoA dehydrogenase
MIDFDLGDDLRALQSRVRAFVEREVIPREPEVHGDPESLERVRRELQAKAKAAGLFLPTLPKAMGGLGLSWREIAVVLEETGRSLLGPQAVNASAPDEGNMHLLAHVANAAQKERWLAPLARGDLRSAFAMTEPMPGAGSDPDLLRTRAEQRGSSWVLDGEKWFITGAEGAAFFIVLARAQQGPTMFLVDAKTKGLRVDRTIRTLDHLTPGGHGQLTFSGCEVPAESMLGAPGKGFELAQFRLVPARLTHCMRWLGVAVRSLEIAARYASERTSFGKKLGEHQSVQNFLADSHIDIEASRLLVWKTAYELDQGKQPRMESSTAKVFVAEAVDRVIDRALQICGALGVSEDVPLSIFYKEARPFRIYDGPSEVHRMSIGRRVLRRMGATR